jgi:fatty-acyl-CoA synthase
MQISDRSKDLIKSGGEWISSVELENIAIAHPELDGCCYWRPHPKWDERPFNCKKDRIALIRSRNF